MSGLGARLRSPTAAVALGSALGALVRWCAGMAPWASAVPWDTLMVNALGSLAMGGFVAWTRRLPEERRPAAVVQAGVTAGFCGGLTTFSIFSAETVALAAAGAVPLALAYVAATVLLSVGGAALGFRMARY